MTRIPKAIARSIVLDAQGLTSKFPFGKGVTGTMRAIRHLGYIQLDTLAVVARAHHHTLWNRNSSYTELHLHTLVKERKVFEYWSHAASYLPMEDYRYTLPKKALHRSGHAHWFSRNKKLMAYVLDRIRAEGPLQSKDFETDRKRGSWFDWKPAKVALEQLFMEGSLMVSARSGFQKVYDLTERVLPSGVPTGMPTANELAEFLIRFNLRALGICSAKDFTHLRRGMQPHVARALKRLLKSGELQEISIDDIKEPHYVHGTLNESDPASHKGIHILSPFDNLIIRRERVNRLFGYDYNLECYLPEPKRKFGYFCLPVLHKGQFAGMFDPKADRATGILHVKNFHPAVREPNDAFIRAFVPALQEFAAFNGCDKIQAAKSVNPQLRKALNALK